MIEPRRRYTDAENKAMDNILSGSVRDAFSTTKGHTGSGIVSFGVVLGSSQASTCTYTFSGNVTEHSYAAIEASIDAPQTARWSCECSESGESDTVANAFNAWDMHVPGEGKPSDRRRLPEDSIRIRKGR